MKYFLLADDTKIANKEGSSKLLDERATIVSCAIPIYSYSDIFDEIDELKKKYGVDEFHFTELYNRKNQFKNFTPKMILDVIQDFTSLISDYKIKIFTQTISDELLNRLELKEAFNELIKYLNFTPTGDYLFETYALIMNIIIAKKYLGKDQIAAVCCDEGIKKSGGSFILNSLKKDIPVYFENSKDELCLQLADFCAWSLSRVKQTLNKSQGKKMKDFEVSVVYILQDIQENYVNLPKITTNVDNGINYDETCDSVAKKKNSH